MHISEIVFKRQPLFYFLICCGIAGGVLAFQAISKLEDPEIVIMQARVITLYPGASAHEVELQVTDVLEREISSLNDINLIISKSVDNLSVITVELEMTVPQEEIQQRWEFLRRKVKAATPSLPAGVQEPVVADDFGDVYGMFYALTGGDYTYTELSHYAGYVRRELLRVKGVNRIHIYGSQAPVTNITFSLETMGQLGVYPVQIMSAVTNQNQMVYAGALETGDYLMRMAVSDKITDLDDIKNISVQGINGEMFRLGDIAVIENGYSHPARNTLLVNEKKAMAIAISMESGENIIAVGKRVEERVAELQNTLPAGIQFEKIFFQPDKVKEAVHGFMWNLVVSLIIVILVLMITMGLRGGIIIGIVLILTVLSTFPVLYAAGGTLQRISLGAFIVAMGMLVDNSIVVLDGILVDNRNGLSRTDALTRSAKRTALPLLGATLIAITAFLPVYLSGDTAGTYARDLFVVLCISLLISWLFSMTLVPVLSDRILPLQLRQSPLPGIEGNMHKVAKKVLACLIRHKTATVACVSVLMIVAVVNIRNVKNAFFPDFNYDQVYIEYILPNGTSPDRMNRDLKEISAHLLTMEEVKLVVASQGMTPARYCLVRAIGEAGDNYGELIVSFQDYKTMLKMKPALENFLHHSYPDALIRIRKYNLSIKSSHTVEVEFKGPDPAVLKKLSAQAQAVMRNNPYTDKYTICDDWNRAGVSLLSEYDQTLGAMSGVTRQDVSNALLASTEGIPLGKYHDGQTARTILLDIRNHDGSAPQNMNDIPVWSMLPNPGNLVQSDIGQLLSGTKTVDELSREIIKPVPLSAVTSGMCLDWSENLVRRVNGLRAIQAQCDPVDGVSPAKVRKTLMQGITAIVLPEGYTYEWVGEYELQHAALKNIFSYLPVSILMIVLILITLFNDLRKPLIILACIPLTAVGIVPGLILNSSPFTFMAIVGAIGLLGMLIKNSIVLLDEMERQTGEGIPRYTAVVNATILRTRPVLMASVTTMLGMIPLLTDPMYKSMAVTIISGLAAGTLITLVFVPILFVFFFRVERHEK